MDDYNISNLHESKNEWTARLVTLLTPLIAEGIQSIFDESYAMCLSTGETNKYMMTFQNFLSRIPKWNASLIETERKRIVTKSGCPYLEDLIACVHIVQLKILSCMRVCQKQKKIDVDIVKLDDFIHKIYIQCARKIYKNVYLYELNISPLLLQKHRREIEILIQEAIMITIRESIPVENLLRAYMDESVEAIDDMKEDELKTELNQISSEITEIPPPPTPPPSPILKEVVDEQVKPGIRLSFNDVDSAIDTSNKISEISAPKTIERLESISASSLAKSKLEAEEDTDYKIKLSSDPIKPDLNVESLDANLGEIEELI